MNLCLLFWLLTFLTIGNGHIYLDMVTVEVPTDEFNDESTSGLKMYSTGADYNQHNAAGKEDDSFLGTTFFQGPRKQCFTSDEIALLRARQGFEWLVPKTYPKYLSNNNIVHMLIRYWNVVNQIVYHMTDDDTESLVEEAFYDTLGAYLRYHLLPMAQVSFYAGRLTLNTVENLLNVKRECHDLLKTDGYGWRMPGIMNITDQLKGLKIEPAKLGFEVIKDGTNICNQLDLGDNSDKGRMLWLLPNLEPVDDKGYLTNIYLPFREKRMYSLRSSSSASQLKRFLNTIAACHTYMDVSPKHYNHMLLDWIQEFVPQHLADEQFYPGLVGILQIQESLLQASREEVKDEYDSGKPQRSIHFWAANDEQELENPYMDERLYIAASIVLSVIFLSVAIILHCTRICGKKRNEDNSSQGTEEIELVEVTTTVVKPKRVKKEKKVKIETPKSPLKKSNDRRYYGHTARSMSNDDRSTSTLGYQLKHKVMPIRFDNIPLESVRKSYKYSPLSSQHELQTCQCQKKKKSSRGK
ncbi:uncharacterized protein LOC110181942 [Drosophila serrata]|uniref:uncharacterized protein LOC110181942 n=1 Tax=Drosophila serrata TaxID=7274 RepID=UPI000A1D2C99|nr:uncharacterized protein LOC110181942 [Drosophila serrata]